MDGISFKENESMELKTNNWGLIQNKSSVISKTMQYDVVSGDFDCNQRNGRNESIQEKPAKKLNVLCCYENKLW